MREDAAQKALDMLGHLNAKDIVNRAKAIQQEVHTRTAIGRLVTVAGDALPIVAVDGCRIVVLEKNGDEQSYSINDRSIEWPSMRKREQSRWYKILDAYVQGLDIELELQSRALAFEQTITTSVVVQPEQAPVVEDTWAQRLIDGALGLTQSIYDRTYSDDLRRHLIELHDGAVRDNNPVGAATYDLIPSGIKAVQEVIDAHTMPRIVRLLHASYIICESPLEVALLTALTCHAISQDMAVVLYDSYGAPRILVQVGVYEIGIEPQHVTDQGVYRCDFCLTLERVGQHKSVRMIVECDGHEWHERTREQAASATKRDRMLQRYADLVYHYTGSELWADVYGCAKEVCSVMMERLGGMSDE